MDFRYQAKNHGGALVEGSIDAPSEDQAVLLLHQKDLYVLSLQQVENTAFKRDVFSWFRKPSRKDLIIFTRQLSTLIDADIPLLESLPILEHQTEHESFRRVLAGVIAAVEGGATLSIALSEHEKVFGTFFTSLVRVGEVSGKLQETLLYLADYLERSASLTSKIRGAIFYPTFVLSAMLVVTIIMMTTVIPQLLTIVRDSGVTELPLPTRMLVSVSDFFQHYVILLVVLIIIAIVGVYYYVRTPPGRLMWDRMKISLPRFGRIFRDLYLARIAETLSVLVKSGVPIIESITVTSNVIGNEVYRLIFIEARHDIQSGGSLSATLEKHDEFPKLVSSMLSTGERTGRTEAMLNNILKFYKTEAENDVSNLTQLIEPVLILVLGVGVGLLVSAILLPIYSLINVA